MRSTIAANQDEYIGQWGGFDVANYVGLSNPAQINPTSATSTDSPPNLPPPIDNPVRAAEEAADLFKEATEQLSCYGADINNPEKQKELGMKPNFSPKSSGTGASFSPVVNNGFGFTAGAGVGTSAVAGGGFNTRPTTFGESDSQFSVVRQNDQFQSDSLGVVYGRRTSGMSGSVTRRRRLKKWALTSSTGMIITLRDPASVLLVTVMRQQLWFCQLRR